MGKRWGLLGYDTPNIGDDIQSVAARQYLPTVDCIVNRDTIGKFSSSEPTKIILNGWFMHSMRTPWNLWNKIRKKGRTVSWPPSKSIEPLFVSFHVSKDVEKHLINDEMAEYYKQYTPIGCRDQHTVDLLKGIGVDAYYSACLTLTLKPTVNEVKREGIYFVDPFGPVHNFQYSTPGDPEFQNTLWEKFPENIRQESEYITHQISTTDVQERQLLAEKLLAKYASAKLVITSRIHCAFPCLAFGTPVVFITPKGTSSERFDGTMYDFFSQRYSLHDIENGDFDIDWENPKPNSQLHTRYAKELEERCNNFVNA